MLRYFYLLLCFLLCIDWIFCYDYNMSHGNRVYGHSRRHLKRHNARGHNQVRGNLRRSGRHKEYDANDDREQMAQIDLASFVKNEEIAEESPYEYEYYKRMSYPKKYGVMDSLHDVNYEEYPTKKYQNADYLEVQKLEANLKDNYEPEVTTAALLKPAMILKSKDTFENTQLNAGDGESDQTRKSGFFKTVQFPFFSRNRTCKFKKDKNKQGICFSATKSLELELDDNDRLQVKYGKPFTENQQRYKRTRSHQCLKCERKSGAKALRQRSKKKHKPRSVIHNSRQFYASLSPVRDEEPTTKQAKIKPEDGTMLKENPNNKRRVRSRSKRNLDADEKLKERHTKDLEEIKKKVHDVETKVSTISQV